MKEIIMTTALKKTFLPIIIGTDLNEYTMNSSFYDRYVIKPVLVGKLSIFFTLDSSIIETTHYDKQITDPELFKEPLKIVAEHYGIVYELLILIATNDIYLNIVIVNRDFLAQYYKFNIPS